MRKRSISFKLFLIIVFSIGISLVILSLIWLFISIPVLERNVSTLQIEKAKEASYIIENFISARVERLNNLAKSSDFSIVNKEKQKKIIDQTIKDNESFKEVAILDETGQETIKISRTSLYMPEDLISQSASQKFQTASQDQIYISPVYTSPQSERLITLAVPIKSSLGKILGVISAEINLKFLWQNVEKIKITEHSFAYVVDSEGKLIAHPDISEVFKGLILTEERGPVEKIIKEKSTASGLAKDDIYINEKGVRVIGAGVPVEKLNWGVIVEAPYNELRENIYTLWITAVVIILVSLVWSFIISRLFSRRITSPIEKLFKGVKVIGDGNLNHRIHIGTKDEIEELGRQFNEMAGKLKESYSGLEEKIERATGRIEEDKVKLEALLKNLGEGICALDEERNIILFNPELEKITGYSRDQFINRPLSDFLEIILASIQEGIGKSRKNILLEILTKQFTSRTFLIPQFYALTKDKKSRILALISTPVLIEGKTKGRINVFRDITREKEIEKMKTQFVSIASHQLRTPLTSIKWYIEMLISGEMGKLPEEQQKFLKQIYGSNERMISLVNDLLNVSRIEEGKVHLEPKWFSWTDLIKEEIKEITPLIQASNCEILFSPPSLPKVWADPQKVRQVIQNFLSNGIKYSHPERKGKIEVSLSKKDNCLLCAVKDNGIGIPEKEQQRIFTKFFRAENIQILQAQGTGLGLFICKGIIEASGGKIWFESKENKGTTFYCTLPIKNI